MRAYQLPQGTGIDALVKVDLPTPKLGQRQALIKIAACSLNFRDLAIALGSYRMPTKPNLVPLSDGAGEVVEIRALRPVRSVAIRMVPLPRSRSTRTIAMWLCGGSALLFHRLEGFT